MNCRINQKLMWMGRMALEAREAKHYAFITLTYDDDHLPADQSIDRHQLKWFVDKLRRNSSGPGLRYFGVGEYGDRFGRPHYHVILFGVEATPVWAKHVENAWTNGHTGKQLGLVQVEAPRSRSALAYVLGYVTKKMTTQGDDRLDGRKPEFRISSNHPPLGRAGLNHLADMLTTRQGATAIAEKGFPRGFVLEGQYYPFMVLDRRYLMDRAGYEWTDQDHRLEMEATAWMQFEEYEVYKKAQTFHWSAAKLRQKLHEAREIIDVEAQEQRRELAIAKAAKRRRRWLEERGKKAPVETLTN